MAPDIRVVLADDHHLVRAGIRALLERVSGLSIVGEASDGHEALRLVETLAPDLLLTDIAMPGLNGLTLSAKLAAEHPRVRVIIVSMHHSDAYVAEALRAGASGYLLKDASLAELELAVRAVASGGKYLTPAVSKQMVDAYLNKSTEAGAPAMLSRLTLRQQEVLQAIAEGCGTKEIARRLNISVKTVETHRADLMRRLDIHDVAGLVRYAIQSGLSSSS
jgi:DNA-binding NarL/FixJ family response regulator